MSKPLFGLGLGLFLIFLTSCKKNLGQMAVGNQDRTSREIHDYTYNGNGDILTDKEVVYDLINERVTDTTLTTYQYTYVNGKLIKIDIESEVTAISKTKLYTYDIKDSLTLELWIELNGDTTYLNRFEYDKNGNKVVEETRKLWDKRIFEEMRHNPTKMKYDTSYIRWENEFKNNLCVRAQAKNIKGEIESEMLFTYENGKQIKAETYKFLGTIKYLHSTQTFDYSKFSEGEYQTIDKDGLPIESLTVEIRSGKLYKRTWIYNTDLTMEFFDSTGRKIKYADFTLQRVTDYKYDEKGNKIEIFEFPMPDTDFNREHKSLTKILESTRN